MTIRHTFVFVAAMSLATVAHANTAGTLYVVTDTTLTADHDGNVVILADNVTLNCDGHKVNGPGETDDADLGLWCGPSTVTLKRKEEKIGSYSYSEVLTQLKTQLDRLIEAQRTA